MTHQVIKILIFRSNFGSDKPRDKERDQRTEHEYKQANISSRAREGYDSKHSGTDRRDDKFSNEQRNKYGDRNYRDDKR